ncbi:MAG: hypothetical protein NE328_12740 [Lentisphaeraceae bacterium]|nr:hypothetical protein [Lentisphaeraceae bacterium]
MFVKKFILVFLIIICTQQAFADSPPSPFADGVIKIDGDGSDWSSAAPFMNEFGINSSSNEAIDAKSFHMGFSKSNFYFKVILSPSPDSFSANEELSILQIMFDADMNDSTGNRDSKVYKVIPKGFETRFELFVTQSKEVIGRLYSSDDNFNRVLKEWKSGSENLASKNGTVEIKIPFSLINFTPGANQGGIRMLFAEYANMADKGGYSKQSLTLAFSVLDKLAPVVAEKGATGESGFTIWKLIVLALWVVSILCAFAIAPKAGLSPGLAALNFIPFLGQIAFLFILAFGQWPMHKDYQKLEDRLREFDEEV